MKLGFSESAWQDYLYWQRVDKRVFMKINSFIQEILRSPFEGKGKPEPLKYELQGCWSRRIDAEHRLVYKVMDNEIFVVSVRYHY